MQFLSHLSEVAIISFSNLFRPINYKRSCYVYRQGMPATMLYIIKSGTFEHIRKTRYKPEKKQDDSFNNLLIGPGKNNYQIFERLNEFGKQPK
jgi:hypothetical protein